jgi:hypothetical protein
MVVGLPCRRGWCLSVQQRQYQAVITIHSVIVNQHRQPTLITVISTLLWNL